MDVQKKFDLIIKNTAEVLTSEDLRKLLEEKKNPTAYLGVATTGPVHAGYFVPLGKLFDFGKAEMKNKILLADVHAALDDLKTSWDQLDAKTEYYKKCIELAYPWEKKPTFVQGSSFQIKSNYQLDVLKMSTLTTITRATRAASEVTRMKNPKVSELIYPIMQTLDEQYLDADIQLGGQDQRHIMAFAREYLPLLQYKAHVEVMTPLVVSLKGPGVKMSASLPESSIKIYESEASIKEKISKAYCLLGEVNDNPILQLCKYTLFPVQGSLKIERPAKFGGDLKFENYEDLEHSFAEKKVHPLDLKNAVAAALVRMFKKVRTYFEKNNDLLKKLGQNFLA